MDWSWTEHVKNIAEALDLRVRGAFLFIREFLATFELT